MTNLGKCLLFYLKYPAEMERLYGVDERTWRGCPTPDRVLNQIWRVGDLACREGADLLEACVPGIEAHFRTISTIERVRSIWKTTGNSSSEFRQSGLLEAIYDRRHYRFAPNQWR